MGRVFAGFKKTLDPDKFNKVWVDEHGAEWTETFIKFRPFAGAKTKLWEECEAWLGEGNTLGEPMTDEKRAQLAATEYIGRRQDAYPPLAEQLDALWHDIDAGKLGEGAKESNFYGTNREVKRQFPKSTG